LSCGVAANRRDIHHPAAGLTVIPNYTGTNCFMNAMMQCFARLPAMRALFGTGQWKDLQIFALEQPDGGVQDGNMANAARVVAGVAAVVSALGMPGGVCTRVMMADLRNAVAIGPDATFRVFAHGQHDPGDFYQALMSRLHSGLNVPVQTALEAVQQYGGLAVPVLPALEDSLQFHQSEVLRHQQVGPMQTFVVFPFSCHILMSFH
jgi:hypothetical protein